MRRGAIINKSAMEGEGEGGVLAGWQRNLPNLTVYLCMCGCGCDLIIRGMGWYA